MSLKNVLESYESTRLRSVRALDEIPYATRPAHEADKNKAKLELITRKAAYKDALLKAGIGIFLLGDRDKVQQFYNTVIDDGGALTADAEALYRRLATPIEPSFGKSRQYSADQAMRLNNQISVVMNELGLDRIMAPHRETLPRIPNFEALIQHVRDQVRGGCGDELNQAYVMEQVTQSGITFSYTKKYAPVVVINTLPEEIGQLGKIFGVGFGTINLTAEDEITEEFIANAFKNVNTQIKQKNN